MRNVSSQSCLLISASLAMRRMPALLTRISSLPRVWTSASTARCTAAMSVTSAAAIAPARFISRTRSAVASAARPSMSITPTSQPSCAKRSAMPRPIPEPAPVTIAVLPSSAYMLAILLPVGRTRSNPRRSAQRFAAVPVEEMKARRDRVKLAAGVLEPHVEEIHGRRADEARHEPVLRPVVDLERRADLLDAPVPHHRDAVAERHRLDLVVSHVHRGDGDALAQALELDAHVGPELGIEVGQRLVEQKHLRMAHDAAPERHPLLLPAGELARLALEQIADAENLRGAGDLLADHFLAGAPVAQAEREIVVDRHVLIERVVLEHHGDVAVLRRQPVHHALADADGARRDLLEAGDEPQRRRLAATRGTDQHHEFLVLDLEIEVDHGRNRPVGLADLLQCNFRHGDGSRPKLRCPGSPAGQMRSPRMTYRCANKVTSTAGPMASTAIALMRFHCVPSSVTNCAMVTVIIAVLCPVRMSANRNSFQV